MLHILALSVILAAAPLPQIGDPQPTILEALLLPALMTEARNIGIPDALVRDVLDKLRVRGVPAEDAAVVIRDEVDAVKAGAPKDNFGAFVNQQLDAGLRGRALAAAIHAQHRARGMGRPGDRPAGGRDNGRARGRTP